MDRRVIETLILGDDDLECKTKTLTLSDLSLANTSFTTTDLAKYDLIVYTGLKGTKILKSRYFKIGKVG